MDVLDDEEEEEQNKPKSTNNIPQAQNRNIPLEYQYGYDPR
jgi:hypothetical protein